MTRRITNNELPVSPAGRRITNNARRTAFFIFLVSLFIIQNSLFIIPALAHSSGGFWTPGEPIVPCGYGSIDSLTGLRICPININLQYCVECTKCELWHLLKHIIDFLLIVAAPVLATLFFIIAGVYMMLGGANPGMLSTGKNMFKNTFIGLLLVMMAWLITNTLIQSLVNPSVYGTGPGTQWYSFTCT
jgi:hypothetical protein